MAEPQPLVRNAADNAQVQAAGSKAKQQRDQELADIKAVLAIPGGRRFLWRLLKKCKVFETIWHPSALIHYNSGQQDIGHYVQGEIVDASEEAYLQMMQEAKQGES